ncbi:hypothetical protein G6F56_009392 [Rhizopus delemar]|nr:hypothetical protein G6F56_009392 [Rhizopus delemar]
MFISLAENFYASYQPKLTAETILKLKSLVTIFAAYNREMPDQYKIKLKEHEVAQASLESLKSFPNAFDIVTGAPKLERTFWIDRIIPIFQAMGDQTGLVGFEWCELNPEPYMESTIEKDTRKRGPLRNVDGLEYSNLNTDMIVMEASSGQKDEDLMHTKDDILKNIHGFICALETSLRRYPHAQFMTATNLFAFSGQPVCTTIDLSITSLDSNNPGKYIHQECRTAEIPMNYRERIKWLKFFEFVTCSFIPQCVLFCNDN